MNYPEKSEYNPYFQTYLKLVPKRDFLTLLNENTQETVDFYTQLPLEKHNYKYAEDKWTIKEVLMHVIDTERVFAYRALVCLRGDNSTVLHDMDEGLYASHTDVTSRSLNNLVEEFIAVRKNTRFLFQNATEEQSKFPGNGLNQPFTARALGHIMIGHNTHHMNVIRNRYFL
ncbi:MAG: DinB family protein [Saprospiraceae bacterium]